MLNTSVHPTYLEKYQDWEKFRYTLNGGIDFIEQYLVTFSDRESAADFKNRKTITPIPGFASAAIIDVKNAIFQRLDDVSRAGGSEIFNKVMTGELGGVDLCHATMPHFIGRQILPELLFLGKVGVYVDMPQLSIVHTKQDAIKIHPYYYTYVAEQIRNWVHDGKEYTKVLLEEEYLKHDNYGLPSGTEKRYRFLEKTDSGVTISFYDNDEKLIDTFDLKIKSIPFVLFELNQSMLQDIANHQIALLNMESADVAYALKANFPFYTEQTSGHFGSTHLKNAENTEEGTNIDVGTVQGRQYGQNLERPGFIHPSAEPLQASMEKQKNLKDDIRGLVNLALSAIRPKFSSAESKQMDEKGLESGLSFLGLVLEHGERQLAELFSQYENDNTVATIHYPERYNLKTDQQRLSEAESLGKQMSIVPSKKYQKAISKEIVKILLDAKVSNQDLEQIIKEIDKSNYISSNPDDIHADIERGLVSLETAAVARGYNKDEVKKAAEDHAERIKRIQESQEAPGARGINDLETGDSAKDEKNQSQDPDNTDTGKKKVRGNEQTKKI